jgi:hypothetical protein
VIFECVCTKKRGSDEKVAGFEFTKAKNKPIFTNVEDRDDWITAT